MCTKCTVYFNPKMTSKISSVHCTMLGTFTHLSKPCTVPTQPQVEMIKIVLTATLLLRSGSAAGGVSERLGHYIQTSLARCSHTGTCLTTPWHGTTLTQVAPSWVILGQGGSQGALYYPAGGSQGSTSTQTGAPASPAPGTITPWSQVRGKSC